jgi:hypothetical protein
MFKQRFITGLLSLTTCFAAITLAGCERKERVIDVKAPGVDVKVDRNVDSGRIDVEANRK